MLFSCCEFVNFRGRRGYMHGSDAGPYLVPHLLHASFLPSTVLRNIYYFRTSCFVYKGNYGSAYHTGANLLAFCASCLLFKEIWTHRLANERLLRQTILSPHLFLDVSSASAGRLGLFADLRLSESINPSIQNSGKVEGNLEHWPSADPHQRGKNETKR